VNASGVDLLNGVALNRDASNGGVLICVIPPAIYFPGDQFELSSNSIPGRSNRMRRAL
jgi:hypothetical protein